jgi:hypothetical protein
MRVVDKGNEKYTYINEHTHPHVYMCICVSRSPVMWSADKRSTLLKGSLCDTEVDDIRKEMMSDFKRISEACFRCVCVCVRERESVVYRVVFAVYTLQYNSDTPHTTPHHTPTHHIPHHTAYHTTTPSHITPYYHTPQ